MWLLLAVATTTVSPKCSGTRTKRSTEMLLREAAPETGRLFFFALWKEQKVLRATSISVIHLTFVRLI